MLRLSQITKRYDERTVLDAVDLDLDVGKTYSLIGPSGCGKSTLLRIMIGLIQPDDGEVFLNQQPLTSVDIMAARAGFGYVIQTGGLFPHLTAYENAALPAQYRKWAGAEIAERIRELSDLTHLPRDMLNRYPAQLSGGQRQRVSLMRALMLDPGILLMDEPLGALDPMIRSQLQIDLREIFRDLGKTVVIVTHDLHEAAYFANQIVLMKSGVIIQRGSIRELLEHPANDFVTEFVEAQQGHLLDTVDGGAA